MTSVRTFAGRAAFKQHQPEIMAKLAEGWSASAVHAAMQHRLGGMNVKQFRRYARRVEETGSVMPAPKVAKAAQTRPQAAPAAVSPHSGPDPLADLRRQMEKRSG